MKNTDGPLSDYTDLWNRPGFLIRRLHQIHVAMFLEECDEFNITPVQFGVLTVLISGETFDQVSIANQLGVDRNTVADVVRRLEKRGLLERPASTQDRRTKLAKITTCGIDFVNAVQPEMVKAQQRFANPLSRAEYRTLMHLMGKLVQANNEASRAPLRLDATKLGDK